MKPLGLPTGSVRAILALLIIGVFVGLCAYSVIAKTGEFVPALAALGVLAGSVTEKYFEKRQGGG